MNKQKIREIINPLLLFLYKLFGIKVLDSLLFCSQDKKRIFIKESYEKQPKIRTFIETGTYKGDTVEFVKNDFDKIYSIELDLNLAKEAVERFSNETKIKILEGDSANKIHQILDVTKESCIFWLDGHYSYGTTARAEKETPIQEELRAILKHEYDHFILIDDARLFIGKHSYPWLLNLFFLIKKINKAYKVSIKNDIIIISK